MKSKVFDWTFLLIGWLVQIFVYWLAPSHPMALVSGLLGITSVILCSQGNILTFFFGFGQILTYTYLCWLERFYAGIAMNVFYFLSQIYGIYAWRKLKLSGDSQQGSYLIAPRELSGRLLAMIIAGALIVSAVAGWLLSGWTDDTQPYLDALTTTISIVAQILLVMAYRQQWWLWLAVDIIFIGMWCIAGNWSMVAQYVFWCINCLYGLQRWKKLCQE